VIFGWTGCASAVYTGAMGMTFQEIAAAALELPEDQRSELLFLLDQSLLETEPLSEEWLAEIKRRWSDLEAGNTRALPGEQVLAEGRARLNARL
jgi:putative addiction module component (TIGR02574 family)